MVFILELGAITGIIIQFTDMHAYFTDIFTDMACLFTDIITDTLRRFTDIDANLVLVSRYLRHIYATFAPFAPASQVLD